MPNFDITPAGAFMNAIDAASNSSTQNREPVQPVEKPRKPVVRHIVMRLIAIFVG